MHCQKVKMEQRNVKIRNCCARYIITINITKSKREKLDFRQVKQSLHEIVAKMK